MIQLLKVVEVLRALKAALWQTMTQSAFKVPKCLPSVWSWIFNALLLKQRFNFAEAFLRRSHADVTGSVVSGSHKHGVYLIDVVQLRKEEINTDGVVDSCKKPSALSDLICGNFSRYKNFLSAFVCVMADKPEDRPQHTHVIHHLSFLLSCLLAFLLFSTKLGIVKELETTNTHTAELLSGQRSEQRWTGQQDHSNITSQWCLMKQKYSQELTPSLWTLNYYNS